MLVAAGAPAAVALQAWAAWHADDSTGAKRTAAPGASAFPSGHTYGCDRVRREHGAVTAAGYSTSRDVLLDRGSTGWDVVEAQCLLRWHGFDSGRVDGVYGEKTGRAALAFQKRYGLAPDGVVGPDTWKKLRT